MKKRIVFFLVFIIFLVPLGFGAETKFSRSEKHIQTIPLGEKMTFKISYLGLKVGEAVAEVKEIVKIGKRDAYHIVVTADSGTILRWLYPVHDVHHSYVDTERLHSLKYEKEISEGRYQTHKMMEYDQEEHIGRFYSFVDKTRKEMFIPLNVQDQLSCAYWFRLQDVKPNSKISIPVNADEKNWDLEAITHEIKEMSIDGIGNFQAIEVEPIILFEGLFVKRGKIRGWMSMDERRIPLMMKVKIPVLGDVTATLTHYEAGQSL